VAASSPSVDHEVSFVDERIVLVADRQMRYLAASAGACRVLGYSLEELLALRVTDVVKETDAKQRYRRMVEEGRQEGEITLLCKDGRPVRARYEAHEAQADGVPYYVSKLTPLGPVSPDLPVGSRMRVLIVDDDQPTRFLIRTLLSFIEPVEVIAEAADGAEAVQRVIEQEPDLVLLDVQMPKLNGLAAAELIQSLRPQTHIVLHSAAADPEMQQRAARLGLQLLDKMHLDDAIEALIAPPPRADGERADPRIETAVVTALTARSTVPVVIVGQDRSVPFYNMLAADLLGLPLPAKRTDLDTVRRSYQALDPDTRRPVEPRRRPIERSISEREPIAETFIVARGGTTTLCRFTSLPFFDNSGDFVGAALYIEPLPSLHLERADGGPAVAGVVSKDADHAENVPPPGPAPKPKLVFFYSERSGRSRRVEGFLAQVLQRRRNHETFELVRVSVERHPELAERFAVTELPTICIVEGRRLRKRIIDPRGGRQLEAELAEWLR
jgi:CheY-like chemotaxis protein